ncbi:hypothetical protein EDC94DRAFT_651242 [Helicostylum pulchrum]|nr:hypothetical protein EDC94DRAFT_651242 [Helicostylum pulchrum]
MSTVLDNANLLLLNYAYFFLTTDLHTKEKLDQKLSFHLAINVASKSEEPLNLTIGKRQLEYRPGFKEKRSKEAINHNIFGFTTEKEAKTINDTVSTFNVRGSYTSLISNGHSTSIHCVKTKKKVARYHGIIIWSRNTFKKRSRNVCHSVLNTAINVAASQKDLELLSLDLYNRKTSVDFHHERFGSEFMQSSMPNVNNRYKKVKIVNKYEEKSRKLIIGTLVFNALIILSLQLDITTEPEVGPST